MHTQPNRYLQVVIGWKPKGLEPVFMHLKGMASPSLSSHNCQTSVGMVSEG